jgi:hypothetical protein
MGEQRIFPDLEAELKAVDLRHQHVREHHVGRTGPRQGQRVSRRRRGDDLETHLREVQPSELELHHVVIHDQHASPLPERRRVRALEKVRADHLQQARRFDGLDQQGGEARFVAARLTHAVEKSGQGQDRHAGAQNRAQLAHQLEAVHVRQHEILQDQRRWLCRHRGQRCPSVPRLDDSVAFTLQRDAEHLARQRVILHHQDLRRAHGPTVDG